MINMSVGDQGKNRCLPDRTHLCPSCAFPLRRALMHAAVNGESHFIRFDNKTGTRYLFCRSEKFNFHDQSFLTSCISADAEGG